MSLKANLINKIKDFHGAVMTYEEMFRYCQMWNFRISNAERRLRESVATGEIENVRSKKGAVIGWRVPGKQGKMW